MFSSKQFLVLCVMIFTLRYTMCKSTESGSSTDSPASSSVSSISTTESKVKLIGDELNGPSNETCNTIGSCNICKAEGCRWSACNDGEPNCVSVLLTQCEEITCNTSLGCIDLKSCDACMAAKQECVWQACDDTGYTCDSGPYEMCNTAEQCNSTVPTTIAPPITISPNTTTTTAPNSTTTELPTTTTAPNSTTTEPPTTTPVPTTTTPESNVTTTPVPETTTGVPSTTVIPVTTTEGPSPTPASKGGFSAGSFFGGMTLTLALLGVGLGGYKFYKIRYDVNYRTL